MANKVEVVAEKQVEKVVKSEISKEMKIKAAKAMEARIKKESEFQERLALAEQRLEKDAARRRQAQEAELKVAELRVMNKYEGEPKKTASPSKPTEKVVEEKQLPQRSKTSQTDVQTQAEVVSDASTAETPAYVEVVLPKGKQAESQESATTTSEEMVELETDADSTESAESPPSSSEQPEETQDINIAEIKEVM